MFENTLTWSMTMGSSSSTDLGEPWKFGGAQQTPWIRIHTYLPNHMFHKYRPARTLLSIPPTLRPLDQHLITVPYPPPLTRLKEPMHHLHLSTLPSRSLAGALTSLSLYSKTQIQLGPSVLSIHICYLDHPPLQRHMCGIFHELPWYRQSPFHPHPG
jgi:hypothetical protein